jgi:hypothetical protein
MASSFTVPIGPYPAQWEWTTVCCDANRSRFVHSSSLEFCADTGAPVFLPDTQSELQQDYEEMNKALVEMLLKLAGRFCRDRPLSSPPGGEPLGSPLLVFPLPDPNLAPGSLRGRPSFIHCAGETRGVAPLLNRVHPASEIEAGFQPRRNGPTRTLQTSYRGSLGIVWNQERPIYGDPPRNVSAPRTSTVAVTIDLALRNWCPFRRVVTYLNISWGNHCAS